jgi:peptidyl-tRNA hydrolase, PTH1 family
MTPGIALIAGLGNPGNEYAETRHNAGLRFLNALLRDAAGQLRPQRRFLARIARCEIAERDVWLLTPTTFMNHSGEALARFARYYNIAVERILVVHDELDLPIGSVRLKQGGGDGGHNGVKDIITQLGSGEFLRLRIGIGRPPADHDPTAYVLRRPPEAERELIDSAIDRACKHIADIVHGQFQQVMNSLHTHNLA